MESKTHLWKVIAFFLLVPALIAGMLGPSPLLAQFGARPPLGLRRQTDFIISVTLSPDSKTLVTGSWNGTIKLWDAKTGKNTVSLAGHKKWINSLVLALDGNKLASGGYDQTVKVWDVSTGKNISILQGHTDWICAIAFSPNGRTLASGSWDKTINL